jgi:hypothetical protein
MDPGAVNILWELFSEKDAKLLRESGVRYGLIATEVADGGGFNTRRDGAWPERWSAFLHAAEGAAFIWSTVERSLPVYAAIAPAAFIELGFVDELVLPAAAEEPPADFSFLGVATPHRQGIIERLRGRARVVWPGTIVRWSAGPRVIQSAKIGLALKQTPDWPLPGPSRLGRIILARRGLAAEHTQDSTQQSRIVPAAPAEADFVEFAMAKLAGPWRQEADAAFERYRAEMPMQRIMERVLDLTCSAAEQAS